MSAAHHIIDGLLDNGSYIRITNLVLQKFIHSHLVGSIQGDTGDLGSLQGLISQAQGGETLQTGTLKSKRIIGKKVQRAQAAINTIRKTEPVCDWRTHVGCAHL